MQGIAELITRPGMINVDFADVRTVMSEMGMAMMGSGIASGREPRARIAAEAAVSSPLLEDINLQGAHGILVNVTAGIDLSIGEFQEVGDTVKQFASDDATVVVGTVIDPEMTRRDPRDRGRDRPRSAVAVQPRSRCKVGAQGARRPRCATAAARAELQRAREARAYSASAAVGDGVTRHREPRGLLDIPAFLRRQAD